MKNKILTICSLFVIILSLFSETTYAYSKIYYIYDFSYNNGITTEDTQICDRENIKEHEYGDDMGGIISVTEANLKATDSVLWDKYYYNENSIKKEIYAKNYEINGNPGEVNVYIKNNGYTTIKVNIYKSVWNSETIASDSISPGSSRVFVIGKEYGSSDCHAGNVCFYYQKFTISVYSNDGGISFYGRAKIYY